MLICTSLCNEISVMLKCLDEQLFVRGQHRCIMYWFEFCSVIDVSCVILCVKCEKFVDNGTVRY